MVRNHVGPKHHHIFTFELQRSIDPITLESVREDSSPLLQSDLDAIPGIDGRDLHGAHITAGEISGNSRCRFGRALVFGTRAESNVQSIGPEGLAGITRLDVALRHHSGRNCLAVISSRQ